MTYEYANGMFMRRLDAVVENEGPNGTNLLVDLGRDDGEKFRVAGASVRNEDGEMVYFGGSVPNVLDKFIN